MRWFFKKYPVIGPALALVVVFMVFITFDGLLATPLTQSGVIIDKDDYSQTVGGTKETYYEDGYENESYVEEIEIHVMKVKTDKGKIYSMEVPTEIYFTKQIGQRLIFDVIKGKFTGLEWEYYAIK